MKAATVVQARLFDTTTLTDQERLGLKTNHLAFLEGRVTQQEFAEWLRGIDPVDAEKIMLWNRKHGLDGADVNRVVLTDGTGRWYDHNAATKFRGDTQWDGHNHVSVSGGKYDHPTLYRTAGGRWVLRNWSSRQGVPETVEELNDAQAAQWLSINGYADHPACAVAYDALEIK